MQRALDVADGDVAARGLQLARRARGDADDKLDLDRGPAAEVESHASVVGCGGDDVAAVLLDPQVELLQRLVRVRVIRRADVLPRGHLHGAARDHLDPDVPARGLDLQVDPRLDGEGFFDDALDLGRGGRGEGRENAGG